MGTTLSSGSVIIQPQSFGYKTYSAKNGGMQTFNLSSNPPVIPLKGPFKYIKVGPKTSVIVYDQNNKTVLLQSSDVNCHAYTPNSNIFKSVHGFDTNNIARLDITPNTTDQTTKCEGEINEYFGRDCMCGSRCLCKPECNCGPSCICKKGNKNEKCSRTLFYVFLIVAICLVLYHFHVKKN